MNKGTGEQGQSSGKSFCATITGREGPMPDATAHHHSGVPTNALQLNPTTYTGKVVRNTIPTRADMSVAIPTCMATRLAHPKTRRDCGRTSVIGMKTHSSKMVKIEMPAVAHGSAAARRLRVLLRGGAVLDAQ